ncbi:CFEM domain protein [Penicillium digitatum]|nr:CFEM domain protein [Penicillium digitatum]
MLVLPTHRILIAILLLLALYSAADDTSSDASNLALYDMIPDCAKDCVDSFIKSEYTPMECTSPSNIKCLCRTKTTSSLTLGEAALSCVLSVCSQTAIAKSMAYHICDSVSEALPKTHQTITATIFSDASVTKTSEAKNTTQATSSSSTFTTEHTSEASVTTSTARSASALTPTTSSQTPELTIYDNSSSSVSQVKPTPSTEQISSNSSEDTNKKGDHGITPAAVIGMSVASGVAGSFIIGVAVFFCCKRWRQRQWEQVAPHSFEIGGAAASEPSGFLKPMPRLPTDGLGLGSSYSPTSDRETPLQWPRNFHPMANGQTRSRCSPQSVTVHHSGQSKELKHQERIGVAISSDSDWEASPRTQSSQHSVAQLLPDPTAGLYPKPLRWSHRPPSGETLFEEDGSQQATAAAAAAGMMHNNLPRPEIPMKLVGLPANPRAFKKESLAGNVKRRSGGPTALAPPFNPNPAFRTSPSDSSAAPDETSETLQPFCPFSNSDIFLAAPVNTIQTHRRNRSSSPGRQALHPHPTPSSSTLPPGSEVASRPQIAGGNDIKRVQIQNNSRPPSEVVAPYCPDDLWLKRGRVIAPPKSQEPSEELPYPSDMFPGAVHYPDSPKKKVGALSNRVSPTSRNLTPARKGADLILHVD